MWQTTKKHLGIGPADAYGRTDRDEILERLVHLEGRVDELRHRLDDSLDPGSAETDR